MEQAVIVHLFPDVGDDWGVDLVEDPLMEAIDEHGVGEFDGHDIALDDSGEVILYAYGARRRRALRGDGAAPARHPPQGGVVRGQALRVGRRPAAERVRVDLAPA
jgi:hypothetical protein